MRVAARVSQWGCDGRPAISSIYHETVVGAPEWPIHWAKWSIHTLVLPRSGRDA